MDEAQVREALDIARELARLGVPIFVAPPDETKAVGFALPEGWQQTAPDPAVVDAWQPGWALCAVMGCGLDLIDIDPRSGGDLGALNGTTPRYYAVAATPSAGVHLFIRSTDSGSRDGVFPGIDVKSGMADGSGRGFAFLSPTVRPSKVTGEPAAYRWAQRPDIEALSASLADPGVDTSGAALAARVRELKASSGVRKVSGPDWWRTFAASREPQSMAAAEKAINDKLAEVREMPPEPGQGQRNIILRAAMTLGGYVGSGYLTEVDAEERLLDSVAQVWPEPDEADRLWVRQGLTDGAGRPFYVYTPEQELNYSEADEAPREPAAQAWNVYTALGGEPFDPTGDASDQGMAEAVAGRMYPVLRYAADAGTWLVRDREVWREREDMASWAISTVARLMPRGDTPVPKDLSLRTPEHWQAERRARFMDSGRSGKVERKLRSIVRNADHLGSVELADLDADPEILWAGGRAWDLRSCIERPVPADLDPATPHLRTASVVPELVVTPVWDRFTAAVFPDPELRAWALRVLSISLTGYPDAALPMLYGPERTGKSSLVALLVELLGSYGHAADPRLLAGVDNSHASVVYALKGRRLSFIDEGPRRGHLATERLKQLTGGAPLTGNAMRANPITFRPTHTLVMTTNDEPPITDPALRARMRIITCDGDKAEVRAARQALTPAVWRREAPGVLAALMGEAAAWLADQDSAGADRAPSAIRAAVDEMAASQNPVHEWVDNCTVPADPGTPGRELYRRFAAWFEAQAIYRKQNIPTETSFGRTLTELGFPSAKVGTGNDRKFYRPLSVFNGGPEFGGRAPWEPATGADGGRVVGGSWAGPSPEPAQSENPSSTPVSSIVWVGWAGSHNNITGKKNTHNTSTNGVHTKSTEKRGTPTRPDPVEAGETSADQPRQGGRVGTSETRPAGERATPPSRDTSATPNVDAPSPKPSGPTNAEVAARAYQGGDEKKISKAEARRQLKEEARLAAVVEAWGGQVHELPAGVGRNGAITPMSIEDAETMIRWAVTRDGALTVDVETTGYPIGHTDYGLRTVQLGAADIAIVFDPVRHADVIRTLLAEAPKLHAHSATADLVPLADADLIEMESAWERMFDTVIPAKLADPSSTGSDPGLKQLASAVLGADSVAPAAEEARKAVFKAGRWLESTKVDTPIERSGWAQIEPGSPVMLRYAASDVLDTAALARALPTIPDALMGRERLAQRLTARVTHRGVQLDYDHVREMTRIHTDARAELSVKVRELLGVENPGSDTQIAKALQAAGAPLKISAKGNPSAAKDELQKLARTEFAEVAQTVLDFRHHDTVLGTFLHPYATLCERGDGRARPTIYTLGTDTGRMSCVRPNLQQLPREGGTRACIVADPGQLMIGADFSGVEIRVAAALSQDPTLLQLIAEGRDLHREVAEQVWGESAGDAERYIAKRIVFGRLYGGGVPTLAAQAGVSETIVQSVIDNLDALTPVLTQWSAHIRNMVKQGHTRYPSYSGRIIHFPREYPHKAPNYAIQGSAREILIDALERWNETRWGNATILPVHDELDAFVPAEEAEDALAALVECMRMKIHGVEIVAKPSKPSPFWADSV